MFTTLTDLVRRTRQHHAIEHATIHLLTERVPQQRFSGYSDPAGFTLYGATPEAVVRQAVADALVRLQAGESSLALHPNCGTNLAVTALLVTLATLIGGSGRRPWLDRFVTALLCVLPALVLARPLGYRAQGYTTLADVADRWVSEIRPVQIAGKQAYRVLFESLL